MSDTVIVQLLYGSIILLEGAFLYWRYRVRVGRPAEARVLRQRVFALRDRAIFLVAEGKASEDDSRWQELYATINELAKAATLRHIATRRELVHALLQPEAPTMEQMAHYGGLPPQLQELWRDLIVTVVSICLEADPSLRKSALDQKWRTENEADDRARYQNWQATLDYVSPGRKDRHLATA